MTVERRGLNEYHKHSRFLEFCDTCNMTSAFAHVVDGKGAHWLVCIGDERTKRKGCGSKKEYRPSRVYGECVSPGCKQIRRVFLCPDGNYYCVVCCRRTINNQTFKTSIDR